MAETCITILDGVCHVSSDECKWINSIKKLIDKYPDDIRVIRMPEDNDGCIYIELPKNFIKIQPPRKLNLSDEDRAIRRDLFKKRIATVRNGDD